MSRVNALNVNNLTSLFRLVHMSHRWDDPCSGHCGYSTGTIMRHSVSIGPSLLASPARSPTPTSRSRSTPNPLHAHSLLLQPPTPVYHAYTLCLSPWLSHYVLLYCCARKRMNDADQPWFAVRCLLTHPSRVRDGDGNLYEERITLWNAGNLEGRLPTSEGRSIQVRGRKWVRIDRNHRRVSSL